jgi:hypothetical protein
MPGPGVAQGSIFTFIGTGPRDNTFEEAGSFPLPLKLGGTSVTVTVGGTQVPAIQLVSSAFGTAAVAAQRFTIPGWVLSALEPASTVTYTSGTFPDQGNYRRYHLQRHRVYFQ